MEQDLHLEAVTKMICGQNLLGEAVADKEPFTQTDRWGACHLIRCDIGKIPLRLLLPTERGTYIT